jgi:hypothetical protein
MNNEFVMEAVTQRLTSSLIMKKATDTISIQAEILYARFFMYNPHRAIFNLKLDFDPNQLWTFFLIHRYAPTSISVATTPKAITRK